MIPLEIEADVSDGATLSGFVAEMQLSGTFSDKIWQILAGMVQTAGTLVGQTLSSGKLVKKVVIAGVVPYMQTFSITKINFILPVLYLRNTYIK